MIRKVFISIWEIAEIALITVATVFVIRGYLLQPFLVSGKSMFPNFNDGDYLLIDELTYRLREPHRGEVVVFHNPNDESVYFIKRVIGLPGEHVAIKGGVISIYNSEHPEGFQLNEKYLPAGTFTDSNYDVKLQSGQYVVLGDNRALSYDSRRWGILSKNEIVGIARVRLWPVTMMKAFAAPHYDTTPAN